MPWSAVTSAVVGSVVSDALGGGSSGSSAAASASDPFAAQRGQYQEQLQTMMTGTFDATDPSYDFRFKQGQQAVERSAGASGLLNSGARLTALTDYGQGQASTEYANQFSRLSQLAGANIGSPAAAGQIMANANTTQQSAINTFAGQVGKAATSSLSGGFTSQPDASGSTSDQWWM